MMRRLVTILLLAAVPGLAAALGLGKIELNSGLNQPFDARIELLSPSAEEIQSLNVDLADSKAFRRAGIDRPFLLSKLKFEVEVNDSGADYIHITSEDPIREPFLNFLLVANWSSGRLFREYTVLLDPPMYDPNAGRLAPEEPAPTTDASPREATERQADRAQRRQAETVATAPPQSSPGNGGDDGVYGPTSTNDTLWSIAEAVRPDDSVSIQQMMLALLRANPEAFIDNNVNGLKSGYILRLPDAANINRLSRAEALAEVRSQYAFWDEARGLIADRARERPLGTPDTGAGTAAGTGADDDSELRVVTPEEGAGAGQTEAVESELRNELALANEQLETLSSENRELQERLTETETIIQDLQRLIALKDEELAALQQQLAAGDDGQTEAAASGEEMTAQETESEPAAADSAVLAEAGEETTSAEEAEPEPAPQTGVPAPTGIVDTVRAMVMENLTALAGGVVLIVLAILALVMVRRRSAGKTESGEETALAGEFPDFDETAESEAPTAVPAGAEDETDFGVGVTSEAGDEERLEDTAGESTVIASVDEEEKGGAPASARDEPETDEEEEDPLAEVNVFLAYEHFEQAEEFVRDAINEQPDNLDFHTKLLEVFYAAGDKAKYEEEARVVYDMVNGEGEYWDMALAMWQEMSPNRALFEEPAEGEEESRADTTGGGIVDLTSDTPGESEAGLDFDLGMEESAADASVSHEDDNEVLDITAGDTGEGSLEQTVSENNEEDILDVTAAVGLGSDDKSGEQESTEDEDYIDIGSEEAAGEDEADFLDVSAGGGEDLLDVTAHSDMEEEEVNEDLLDVTSATGAGADSDELLGLNEESESGRGADDDNTLEFDIGALDTDESGTDSQQETGVERGRPAADEDDDNSLDFQLDTGEMKSGSTEEGPSSGKGVSDDDNVIDFDSASDIGDEEDSGLELDLESGEIGSTGGEADLSFDEDDDDQEFSLSLDDEGDQGGGMAANAEEEAEVSVSAADQEDGQGLDLDFTLDDDEKDALTESGGGDAGEQEAGLSLDIESEEAESSSDEIPEIDMESTVEIPASKADDAEIPSLELDDEEDDDDEDSTVFVPRSSDTDEQSDDDEIATRLDLAKAYVELGDKESARPILEDVIAEGNDEQRRQAREMMDQLS